MGNEKKFVYHAGDRFEITDKGLVMCNEPLCITASNHAFNVRNCPHCDAVVDLARSPHHCPYCEKDF